MPVKNPIIGVSQVTPSQMIAFVKTMNPAFNEAIAPPYITIGNRYGVRGDVAFAQAIHETNWFRYGGDVRPEQNNFAGIGATGGVPGNSFPTIIAGVTAHIQHLFAYATTDPLPSGETLVDPRFTLVRRASAPNWEDLAGKWAVPGYNRSQYSSLEEAMAAGQTYGQQIINLYGRMLNTATPAPKPQPAPTPADPVGYPPNTPQWKIEAVQWMYDQGLLTSEEWKMRIEEPLPLWAESVVLKRLMEKF